MFVLLIFCFASVWSVNSLGGSSSVCSLLTLNGTSSVIFGDCAPGTTDADNIQFYLTNK